MGSVEIVSQGFTWESMDWVRLDELFSRMLEAVRSMLGNGCFELQSKGVLVLFRTGGPMLIEDTIECFAPSLGLASVEFSSPHSANA